MKTLSNIEDCIGKTIKAATDNTANNIVIVFTDETYIRFHLTFDYSSSDISISDEKLSFREQIELGLLSKEEGEKRIKEEWEEILKKREKEQKEKEFEEYLKLKKEFES